MSFRAITFWAGDGYQRWAKGLEASARAHGVPLKVYAADDTGDWQKNTLQKATYILKALEEFPGEDILWVDADCSFLQFPSLFNALDGFHYAVYTEGVEVTSINGSVAFFRNIPAVHAVVRLWQAENLLCPNTADDHNLMAVLKRTGMARVHRLDPAYCWHERWMRARYPGAEPVIEMHCVHMTASRYGKG